MKSLSVTITECKKSFSHLVKEASEKKEEIVITKRGEPVAVLLSYSEYKKIKRQKAFGKILRARRIFSRIKISAKDAYEESRRQLVSHTCIPSIIPLAFSMIYFSLL